MKLNNKGSYTVEASLIFALIFLMIFVLFRIYLMQFVFYYGRNSIKLDEEINTKSKSGIYFTQYERSDTLIFMEKERDMVNYDEKLDYLRLMHSYVLLDELGGKLIEEISTYQ